MVNGLIGNLGDHVLPLVEVAANHDQEHVLNQHQQMAVNLAKEATRNQENVERKLVLVSNTSFKDREFARTVLFLYRYSGRYFLQFILT